MESSDGNLSVGFLFIACYGFITLQAKAQMVDDSKTNMHILIFSLEKFTLNIHLLLHCTNLLDACFLVVL